VHKKFCKLKLCCFGIERGESTTTNSWITKCKRLFYICPQFIQSSFHYLYINYVHILYVPRENSYNLHIFYICETLYLSVPDTVPLLLREIADPPPSPPPPLLRGLGKRGALFFGSLLREAYTFRPLS